MGGVWTKTEPPGPGKTDHIPDLSGKLNGLAIDSVRLLRYIVPKAESLNFLPKNCVYVKKNTIIKIKNIGISKYKKRVDSL